MGDAGQGTLRKEGIYTAMRDGIGIGIGANFKPEG